MVTSQQFTGIIPGMASNTASEILTYIQNEDADIMQRIGEVSQQLAFTSEEDIQNLKFRHDALLKIQQNFQNQLMENEGFKPDGYNPEVQAIFDRVYPHNVGQELLNLENDFLFQQATTLSSSGGSGSSSSSAASSPIIPKQSEAPPIPFYQERDIHELKHTFSNPRIKAWAEILEGKFTTWGASRGDGNCFYRTAYVQFVEHLLKQGPDSEDLNTFIRKIEAINFGDLPYASAAERKSGNENRDALVRLLREYQNTGLWNNQEGESIPNFMESMRDNANIDRALNLTLRALIAQEFLTTGELNGAPLECQLDGATVDSFVRDLVLVEGSEAEGVIIPLTAVALGANIQLHSDTPGLSDVYPSEGSSLTIHSAFRPGHYDILK